MIEVVALCKSFPMAQRRLDVLKDIHLSIADGEMLALVGPSGAGKSTFLHLLGALDRPTSGAISWDGTDLFSQSDLALAKLRNQRIGFVFQFHHLLSEFTALENVMMPGLIQRAPRDRTESQARTLLAEMGLSDRLHHKPGQLSGGEQQRVAIARALLLHPKLVLADEPTGNLDRHTGEAVFALMRAWNKRHQTTFVVVTHNEPLAAQADRVIHMVDGQIAPAAPPP